MNRVRLSFLCLLALGTLAFTPYEEASVDPGAIEPSLDEEIYVYDLEAIKELYDVDDLYVFESESAEEIAFAEAEFCPEDSCFEVSYDDEVYEDTGGDWGEEICFKPPAYWQLPQKDELDVEIITGGSHYDADLEVDKTDKTSASGDFDGPGSFDGTYSVKLAANGSLTFKLQADGSGHKVDIVITIDCNGNVTIKGAADGAKVNVKQKLKGDGSSKNPFTLTFGKITIQWSIDGGDFGK